MPASVEEQGGELIRSGMFSIQVCVPASWTDDEIVRFAEAFVPCGTTGGWRIRRSREIDVSTNDQPQQMLEVPERVACEQFPGKVHVVLEA